MNERKRAFECLVAALRGSRIDDAPWEEVLALGNHALVTPSLARALADSGQMASLPADVREFLLFVQDQNRERNTRLRRQLLEAVAALNALGISPLLLKGAVALFLSPDDDLPSRMTSDLDIAVEAGDLPRAEAHLATLGYEALSGARGAARPQDVGLLELRPVQSHGGPQPALVDRDGFRALIPPPISRARHWIMHDLVKEGDYLRGRLDLRHLYDLVELDRLEGVDWEALRKSLPDRTSRNAFDVQMLALHDLFGVAVPPGCIGGLLTRFHHWRRTFAVLHPSAGAPLRIAGNLCWGTRRLHLVPVLMRRGPVEALRRVGQASFQLRPRSKL